jgi:hypothetical protein
VATTYVRSEDVEFQQIDEEGILLDMRSGHYFRLNPSAAQVWMALESPSTISQIVERLGRLYESDQQQISKDTQRLLGEMARSGVVFESEQITS